MAVWAATAIAAISGSLARKRLKLLTALRMASRPGLGAVRLLGDGVLESGGDSSSGGAGRWRLSPPALCLEGGESTISRVIGALGTVPGLSGGFQSRGCEVIAVWGRFRKVFFFLRCKNNNNNTSGMYPGVIVHKDFPSR